MQMTAVPLPADEDTGRAAGIRRTFADHIPLYLCAILFCGITFLLTAAYHVPLAFDEGMVTALKDALSIIAFFLVSGLAVGCVARLVDALREGEARPVRTALTWISDALARGHRPGNTLHATLAFVPLLVSFDALKEVITRINPFSWDETFSHFDRVLGMGRLPWQWLQPLLGHPLITVAINFAYDFWFLIILLSLVWVAYSPVRDRIRMQYLIAFAFVWFIGGNLLAIVFSSAGPCYFGRLGLEPNPYAAQMAYLQEVGRHWPLWSLDIQDRLWDSYIGRNGEISGISAMPSIHVTAAVLLALFGLRRNRRLGLLLCLYAGVIFIGSIHLAWHYAVDGIAGTALAILFWWMAGIVVNTSERWIGDSRPRTAVPSLDPARG
ncbi:MAG: phosphatase PAP2 family protein [Rhizomicrobium sp.]